MFPPQTLGLLQPAGHVEVPRAQRRRGVEQPPGLLLPRNHRQDRVEQPERRHRLPQVQRSQEFRLDVGLHRRKRSPRLLLLRRATALDQWGVYPHPEPSDLHGLHAAQHPGDHRRALAERRTVCGPGFQGGRAGPRDLAPLEGGRGLLRGRVAPGQGSGRREDARGKRARFAPSREQHARRDREQRLDALVQGPRVGEPHRCEHLVRPSEPASAEALELLPVERRVGHHERDGSVVAEIELDAAGEEIGRQVLVRRHLAPGPDPATLALVAEPLLHGRRHVAVGEPRRIADHHVHALPVRRKPDRPAQVARHVTPHVVAAIAVKLQKRFVRLGENVRGSFVDGMLAVQPAREVADRGVPRTQLQHRLNDGVEQRGLACDRPRKLQQGTVWDFDEHVALRQEPACVPLQRIAQIDGNADGPARAAEPLPQGEQVRDARDEDGDRVDVHPEHAVAAPGDRFLLRQSGRLRGGEKPAHSMEQERPRAAGGVQHPLVERAVDGPLADPRREPVGGVVLTQVVALPRVHEGFVQAFEDVGAHLGEPEPCDLAGDAANQFVRAGGLQQPVEEVGLHRALNAHVGEGTPAQKVRRLGQGRTERQRRHRLCHHGEIRVLEEEVIVVDLGAVDVFEQVRPELPLEADVRVVLHLVPDVRQLCPGDVVGDAVAPQISGDGLGVGRQVGLDRHDGVEPHEQGARVVLRRRERLEGGELAVPHLVGGELGAVGGDADEARAGRLFPLREIAGELLFRRGALRPQVALELENGVAEESVDAAPYLGQRPLEIDGGAVGAEGVDEQGVHQSADLLVPGPGGELGDDLAEALGGDGHGRAYHSRSALSRPDVRIGGAGARARRSEELAPRGAAGVSSRPASAVLLNHAWRHARLR